ncbi:hypothetical protein C8J57DRAFT_1238054 [Mycena rebaudengoi]|nr:hypothetical protein C8J57DRAFT_1238054 [Mycena rebaudengoi]
MCKEWFVGTFEFPPQIRSQIRRFDGGKICGLFSISAHIKHAHRHRVAHHCCSQAFLNPDVVPRSADHRRTALPAPAIDHAHFLHARTVMACTCADAPNTSHENLGTTRRRQLLDSCYSYETRHLRKALVRTTDVRSDESEASERRGFTRRASVVLVVSTHIEGRNFWFQAQIRHD